MSLNNQQLSNGGEDSSNVMKEYNLRKKITSRLNRLRFLKDCLAEQVLPASASTLLKHGKKPFTETAKTYLEEACIYLRRLTCLAHVSQI